jgi:hypothetical protein
MSYRSMALYVCSIYSIYVCARVVRALLLLLYNIFISEQGTGGMLGGKGKGGRVGQLESPSGTELSLCLRVANLQKIIYIYNMCDDV